MKIETIIINWLSLEEKLPEHNSWVKIQDTDNNIILDVLYSNNTFYNDYHSDYCKSIPFNTIKYWSYDIEVKGI